MIRKTPILCSLLILICLTTAEAQTAGNQDLLCRKLHSYAGKCFSIAEETKSCVMRKVTPSVFAFVSKGLELNPNSSEGKEVLTKFRAACVIGCQNAKKGEGIAQQELFCARLQVSSRP